MFYVQFDISGANPNKDACVGKIMYPKGTQGGEAYFVPRNSHGSGAGEGHCRQPLHAACFGPSYARLAPLEEDVQDTHC